MAPVLILVSIFFAGFGVGYATRARRSRKRQERYRLYAPYSPPSLGRPRRWPGRTVHSEELQPESGAVRMSRHTRDCCS
jgi:hypothetical protein